VGTDLEQLAVVEDGQPVGEGLGVLQLMGDKHGGHGPAPPATASSSTAFPAPGRPGQSGPLSRCDLQGGADGELPAVNLDVGGFGWLLACGSLTGCGGAVE
jgi:hypothetical protein